MIKFTIDRYINVCISIVIIIVFLMSFFLPVNLFYIEIAFVLLTTIIYIILNKVEIFPVNVVPWGVCVAYSFFSCVYSVDYLESLKICILFSCSFFIIILIGESVWTKRTIIFILWLSSFMHVVMSYFQLLYPTIFYKFFVLFADAETYNENVRFF